ncbi:hypothetical protein rsdtw13_03510 [Clostridium sp. TW13]|uniref:Uncharacterized protein n=1 Tax=Inconstantimicrobium mannanitabidum TaxID=1604901 RepID=A0ACB5R7C8_9CLOT|nr:hypothetical protein rsdtw13_03510 [Clostridium sp. TW13]
MLVIYIGIYYYYKEFRKVIIIASIIIILLCTAVYFSIDSYTNMNNKYQAIFRGILIDSKTPERDLEELGIDKNTRILKTLVWILENIRKLVFTKLIVTSYQYYLH